MEEKYTSSCRTYVLDNIKELADRNGMTIGDLEVKMDIGKGYFSKLGNKLQNEQAPNSFSLDLIEKTANALGVTMGKILDAPIYRNIDQGQLSLNILRKLNADTLEGVIKWTTEDLSCIPSSKSNSYPYSHDTRNDIGVELNGMSVMTAEVYEVKENGDERVKDAYYMVSPINNSLINVYFDKIYRTMISENVLIYILEARRSTEKIATERYSSYKKDYDVIEQSQKKDYIMCIIYGQWGERKDYFQLSHYEQICSTIDENRDSHKMIAELTLLVERIKQKESSVRLTPLAQKYLNDYLENDSTTLSKLNYQTSRK